MKKKVFRAKSAACVKRSAETRIERCALHNCASLTNVPFFSRSFPAIYRYSFVTSAEINSGRNAEIGKCYALGGLCVFRVCECVRISVALLSPYLLHNSANARAIADNASVWQLFVYHPGIKTCLSRCVHVCPNGGYVFAV